ncbi:MAG: ATPase, partial [Clostridia bacterium]|nr:ATPase [Clostridia bacterium]
MLEDVLNLFEQVSSEAHKLIVVFDEFQEVTKLNGETFEKELRASLIHHNKVSYVFMVSQMHML